MPRIKNIFHRHKTPADDGSIKANDPPYVKEYKRRIMTIAGKNIPHLTCESCGYLKTVRQLHYPFCIMGSNRELTWRRQNPHRQNLPPNQVTTLHFRLFPDLCHTYDIDGNGVGWETHGAPHVPSPLERSGWSWPLWRAAPMQYQGTKPVYGEEAPDYLKMINSRQWVINLKEFGLENRFTAVAKTREILHEPNARQQWIYAVINLLGALFDSHAGNEIAARQKNELQDVLQTLTTSLNKDEELFYVWVDLMNAFHQKMLRPLVKGMRHPGTDQLPAVFLHRNAQATATQRWNTIKQRLLEGPQTPKTRLFLLLGEVLHQPLYKLYINYRHASGPALDLHTRKIHLLQTLQWLEFAKPRKLPQNLVLQDILAPLQRDAQILRAKTWEDIQEPEGKRIAEQFERICSSEFQQDLKWA